MTGTAQTRRSRRASASTARPAAGIPVFLDTTGRRLRRVRVAAGAVVAAALCYAVLLVSAMVGGPTIDAPLLPQPPSAAGTATTPAPQPSATHPHPAAPKSRTPASPPATTPATPPAAPQIVSATTAPSATPEPAPATVASPAPSATPAPGSTPGTSGKSAAAPGQTRRPTPPSHP
ncbi:hypothetical protein [Microbacterium kribbense]|uniref:hypothetical protein n=1 Tax=Microbacterium kribbense TaxID=433645 RepID=UPI0031E234BF